jgi:hypothetical protein
LDHATFIGPVVVQTTIDRGQGLFTTKDVKAGEVLLCEKAIAHSSSSKMNIGAYGSLTFLEGPGDHWVSAEEQRKMVSATVQKLSRNPELLSKYVALYHGLFESVSPVEVEGEPVIDT